MNTRKAISHGLSPILSFILLLSGLALPRQAQAQNRVIIINADQPNVWTLEQAHYLLAQMHRRNLDLRAKRLDDLDPNEINGLRFEVLRQLIEFGATFNQADQFTNQLLTRNKTANSERRLSLTARRDKLREESLELTRQISQLQSDKAGATAQEDKDKIDADIAAKTVLRDKVDKEIEFADNELKTLGDISGDLKATEAGATFDANKLPKSVFDKAFEEAASQQIKDFNQSPQLNATLRLENFLQMQYEIIAKQLTLLRDEVGPGERLLFLELPQTVNVTHHEADKKWAQSWWKIAGYTIRVPSSARAIAVPSPTPLADNNPPITTVDDVNSLIRGDDIYVRQAPSPTPVVRLSPADTQMQVAYRNEFFNLDKPEGPPPKSDAQRKAETAEEMAARAPWQNYLGTVELNNRIVRTVELIPRQSSLNVNDMKLKTRSGAFNFALSTLFGFGSKLNIQRQREQFSQFVQQELYSSAFGKGSREFGWTFTPMPGTERLLSGVRTTYAVVVVPEEATSLVLEANGCYFPRSAYQPKDFPDTKTDEWNETGRTSRNCSGKRTRAFIAEEFLTGQWQRMAVLLVPIPSAGMNGSNAFWVVLISGDNFSSQIGVLVKWSSTVASHWSGSAFHTG